jgi:hypothetical protein
MHPSDTAEASPRYDNQVKGRFCDEPRQRSGAQVELANALLEDSDAGPGIVIR